LTGAGELTYNGVASGVAGVVSMSKSFIWIRFLVVALSALNAACVSLPQPNLSTLAPAPGQRLKVVGSKGPLSPRQTTALIRQLGLESVDAGPLKRHMAIEQVVAGTPLYAGNKAAILQDGYQTFPAMFAAIRGASRSIYLEYYIFDDIAWQGTRLDELLISKSTSGLEVAIIYDGIGSLGTSRDFLNSLSAAGIRLLPFNPLNPLNSIHPWSLNNRDHRKILIADDRVAIVGGVNMATFYEDGPTGSDRKPYWRDTDIEISGPAVSELSRLFRDQWTQQGGAPLAYIDAKSDIATEGSEVIHVLGSSPGSNLVPRYYATVLSAINAAERSVWITAAYFVPTHQEKVALALAAKRGVDVRLLLPSHNNSPASLAVQRSSYARLLKAGVKIFERDGVILHSKSIVIDGVWSVIGSSNFDHRSVLFNDEVDAVVLGHATALDLEQLFRSDLEQGHAIDLAAWRHRSMIERMRELLWSTCTTLL
jgi:cardiolipin synthase A/B